MTLPLPSDPDLAAWAVLLNDAGYWAYILDDEWRVAFVTDELRLSHGDTGATTCVPTGRHWYSTEMAQFRASVASGSIPVDETQRENFRDLGRYVVASSANAREHLRSVIAPHLSDLLDDLDELGDLPNVWAPAKVAMSFGGTWVAGQTIYFRIDNRDGQFVGVAMLAKPAAGMSQLAAAAATLDLDHLERMRLVERPDRRPAAILMADLESSTPLARRLSTAQFFAFGRRFVRAADQCVVDAGGIVGRHAGDGVVAFFLADTAGSESDSGAILHSCGAHTARRAQRRRRAERASRSRRLPPLRTALGRNALHGPLPHSRSQ